MPASKHNKTSLDEGADAQDAPARQAIESGCDLERLAPLVANDEIAWPQDLSADRAAALTAKVRLLRRSRLVKLLARSIAADIARDRSHGGFDDSHQV